MAVALALHVVFAVIWVGGMFFAYMALRPVAAQVLPPPQRLELWRGVFGRFFPWVWLAVSVLLVTGFWMVFVGFGGFANIRPNIHIMLLLGLIMTALFGHVYLAPYRRLCQAVASKDWEQGGQQLAQIRKLIAINLSLGLIVVLVAAGGRYW